MKTTNFEPYGPFKLPRSNGDFDRTPEKKRAFWKKVETQAPSLPDAVGCYIFALKAGRGIRPWYVGKTEKASFKRQTWHPLIYGEVIRTHNGTPMLFLIAALTPEGRFKKPTTRRSMSISALEEMLIETCLQRNKKLVNKIATRFPKTLHVPGYLNDPPGRQTKNARALARLLKT
ncbi:MAG: hypothetical protein ABSF75_09590 [Terracidiphilus sp.]|jgi:hypothetical protein